MRMLSRISLAVPCALLLALSACSDDDNGIVNPPPDTTPPTVTTVTPLNSFQFDVIFNEEVTETSAEDPSHYLVTETGTPAPSPATALQGAPGDTIRVASSILKPDKKSVTVTTWDSMSGINCNLAVQGVSDPSGNVIETPVEKLFAGSSDPDATPPGIASRVPAAGATGVAANVVIRVQFTEPVSSHDFDLLRSGVPVPFIEEQLDATSYRLTPDVLLEFNTTYTMVADATDGFDNAMPQAQWSFTTLGSSDTTPPTLVSTSPANNAVYVNVNANLSMTFSEAIDEASFNVTLVPDPGNGVTTWSNGGKTVTFDPFNPLLDDQQYVLTILPGGVLDLAGNSIVGVRTVVFSTGAALENGRISGTIAGHPGSEASDPTGAIVIAVDGPLFGSSFNVLASATVAGNNTYSLPHLGDGTYWIVAMMVVPKDGDDPITGDAIGAYGVDFATSDLTPDSVVVAGGAQVGGINFPLYDPSAIEGTVTYEGVYSDGEYYAYVGLFDVAGFDPQNPGEPVATGDAYWPLSPQWSINTMDPPLPMGDYYVGAFLDVIVNGAYDVGQEPAGLYGGFTTPTSVHIMNGNDIGGILIPLVDPAPGITSMTIAWPKPVHDPLLKRIQEIARRGQLMAN